MSTNTISWIAFIGKCLKAINYLTPLYFQIFIKFKVVINQPSDPSLKEFYSLLTTFKVYFTNMVSIPKVYQWYSNLPKQPFGLTTLQKEAWEEKYLSTLAYDFANEHLSPSLAYIADIDKNIISAESEYYLDYNLSSDGSHYGYVKNEEITKYLRVTYKIHYDNRIKAQLLNSLNYRDAVEISGSIVKSTWSDKNEYFSSSNATCYINIELILTSINNAEPFYLHARELDLKFDKNAEGSLGIIKTSVGFSTGVLAFIGAIFGGFSGCVSCLNETTQNQTLWADENLFSGLFRGLLIGGVFGLILGVIIGFFKSR